MANAAGPARLLLNQVGDRRHWLGLRLVGTDNLRDMVGTRVQVVRRDGTTLWRRARADGSFASANDPRVLVGLGESDGISLVRVFWPDGEIEEWTDVPSDRYTTLTQGRAARDDRHAARTSGHCARVDRCGGPARAGRGLRAPRRDGAVHAGGQRRHRDGPRRRSSCPTSPACPNRSGPGPGTARRRATRRGYGGLGRRPGHRLRRARTDPDGDPLLRGGGDRVRSCAGAGAAPDALAVLPGAVVPNDRRPAAGGRALRARGRARSHLRRGARPPR